MASTKRLLLHFGAHKTASSALQGYLSRVTSARSELAYFGPGQIRRGDKSLKNLVVLPRFWGFTLRARRVGETLGERFAKMEAERLVVSEENMLGHMLGSTWELYPRVRRTAQFIRGAGKVVPDVEGILLIREQGNLAQSAFMFRTSQGSEMGAEEFAARLRMHRLSWLEVVRRLDRALGGRLTVLPYEAIRADFSGFCQELCATDDIWSDLSRLPSKNASLQTLPLFVIQQLRRHGFPFEVERIPPMCRALQSKLRRVWAPGEGIGFRTERRVLAFVQRHSPGRGEEWLSLTKAILAVYQAYYKAGQDPLRISESRMSQIRAACREDNEELMRRYISPQWHDLWRV